MKTLPRIAIAFSTVALAGLIFVEMHGQAVAGDGSVTVPTLAQALAAQSAASNAAATAPLVNLPDFTGLVSRAAPAVVNIEAKVNSLKSQQMAQEGPSDDSGADGQDDGQSAPGQDDVPEFFKRFFGQPGGPGFPMPQQPRQGTSFGSGFIISADGYLLTNRHVSTALIR